MALNVGFGNAAPAPVALPAKKLEVKPQTAQPSAIADKSQPKKDEVSFTTKAGNFAKSPVGIGTGLLALAAGGFVVYKLMTGKGGASIAHTASELGKKMRTDLEPLRKNLKEFNKTNADALKQIKADLKAKKILTADQTALIAKKDAIKTEIKAAAEKVMGPDLVGKLSAKRAQGKLIGDANKAIKAAASDKATDVQKAAGKKAEEGLAKLKEGMIPLNTSVKEAKTSLTKTLTEAPKETTLKSGIAKPILKGSKN